MQRNLVTTTAALFVSTMVSGIAHASGDIVTGAVAASDATNSASFDGGKSFALGLANIHSAKALADRCQESKTESISVIVTIFNEEITVNVDCQDVDDAINKIATGDPVAVAVGREMAKLSAGSLRAMERKAELEANFAAMFRGDEVGMRQVEIKPHIPSRLKSQCWDLAQRSGESSPLYQQRCGLPKAKVIEEPVFLEMTAVDWALLMSLSDIEAVSTDHIKKLVDSDNIPVDAATWLADEAKRDAKLKGMRRQTKMLDEKATLLQSERRVECGGFFNERGLCPGK